MDELSASDGEDEGLGGGDNMRQASPPLVSQLVLPSRVSQARLRASASLWLLLRTGQVNESGSLEASVLDRSVEGSAVLDAEVDFTEMVMSTRD